MVYIYISLLAMLSHPSGRMKGGRFLFPIQFPRGPRNIVLGRQKWFDSFSLDHVFSLSSVCVCVCVCKGSGKENAIYTHDPFSSISGLRLDSLRAVAVLLFLFISLFFFCGVAEGRTKTNGGLYKTGSKKEQKRKK